MTQPGQPHRDENENIPPQSDPAGGEETVEPPTSFFGILKRLGPGLIIAGSIVGSGELIATTKTGAQAGIMLLWLIIIGCLIKVFVQIELGRYTIGHGETTLSALNKVPGPRFYVNWIVWFWLLMMLLGIGQLGGIVGGVGQAAALSVPISGDYLAATEYPSGKEIEQYLKWDDAILSEWDLLQKDSLRYLGIAGQKAVKVVPPISEEVWLTNSGVRTRELITLIRSHDSALHTEMSKTFSQTRGLSKNINNKNLSDLLERANSLLVSKAASGDIDDKHLKELAEVSEGRRVRLLRGHLILSRRLRELDSGEHSRIYQAVVAVIELGRRKDELKAMKDGTLKRVPARIDGKSKIAMDASFNDLDFELATVRVEEQNKAIATILDPPTWDDKIWAAFVALITAGLLFRGRYQMIQLISTVLVVGFTFVTIGNVIALQMTAEWHIAFSKFLSGLSFQLPEATDGITPLATALATFGIIGVGASELIAYPYWCLEKGYAKFTGKRTDDEAWGRRARGWMKVMRYDAFASMMIYTLATIAFFVMGVAVLYNEGRDPDGMRMVSTLAAAYVPVFGEYAKWLFLGGAVAVLYSTFLVATAGNARMWTDALKIYNIVDAKNQAHHDRALSTFSVVLPFLCLAVFCSGVNPVRAILISGAMQALLLPMIGVGALYFRYTRTDGRIKPGRFWDAMLILSFIGLLIAGTYGAWKQIVKFFPA